MSHVTGPSPSVTARPLTFSDAQAVFELTRDAEIADSGHAMVELEDIRGDWSRPSFDLASQSIGYFENGLLVGYGEIHRNRLEASVHPAHRGRGIGKTLFGWGLERGRDLGYARVGQTVPVTNRAALGLLKSFGCELLWTSWVLELPAGATIDDAPLPSAYRLCDFDPERDSREVYQTFEDAFNEWPNRQPQTFDDWRVHALDRSDFEPWQIIVVAQDVGGAEHIVGACKVIANDGEGWVDQIAVRREARGQGLGRALLVAAFARARMHGASASRLNTDSRTGALGLYEHVGMAVVQTYEHHSLTLT